MGPDQLGGEGKAGKTASERLDSDLNSEADSVDDELSHKADVSDHDGEGDVDDDPDPDLPGPGPNPDPDPDSGDDLASEPWNCIGIKS